MGGVKRNRCSVSPGNELRVGCHVGALDRKSCKNKWRERRRRRSRAQNEKPESRRQVTDVTKSPAALNDIKSYFYFQMLLPQSSLSSYTASSWESVLQWIYSQPVKTLWIRTSSLLFTARVTFSVTFSCVNCVFFLQRGIFYIIKKRDHREAKSSKFVVL